MEREQDERAAQELARMNDDTKGTGDVRPANFECIIDHGEECVPDDLRREAIEWAWETIAALREQVAELEGENAANIIELVREVQANRNRATAAEARVKVLEEALGALGAIGNGYCFCSKDRDPEKEDHEPECRDARKALAGGEGG